MFKPSWENENNLGFHTQTLQTNTSFHFQKLLVFSCFLPNMLYTLKLFILLSFTSVTVYCVFTLFILLTVFFASLGWRPLWLQWNTCRYTVYSLAVQKKPEHRCVQWNSFWWTICHTHYITVYLTEAYTCFSYSIVIPLTPSPAPFYSTVYELHEVRTESLIGSNDRRPGECGGGSYFSWFDFHLWTRRDRRHCVAKYVFDFQEVLIPYYFCFVEFRLVAPSFVRQIGIVELFTLGSHAGYSTWSVCVCVCYHIFA